MNTATRDSDNPVALVRDLTELPADLLLMGAGIFGIYALFCLYSSFGLMNKSGWAAAVALMGFTATYGALAWGIAGLCKFIAHAPLPRIRSLDLRQ
jgi:hypothetical protein